MELKKSRKDIQHDSDIKNKAHKQEYFVEYYKQNKEKILKYSKDYYQANKDKVSSRGKAYWKRHKKLVLDHYGSICACCGENRIEFLTIDHINGGGHRHRQELKRRGKNFLFWLIKNNFPDGYRVLCMNCNFSLGMFGYCPHKQERKT